MQVKCFKNMEDTVAEKEFEAVSYEGRTLTPHTHEVIYNDGKRDTLIEVNGGARQATGPLRYARVEVYDGAKLVWRGAIDGTAMIVREEFLIEGEVGLIGYTDEQLRDVLVQRKVKFKRKATSDELLALVTADGLPTAEELGVEVTEADLEADEQD